MKAKLAVMFVISIVGCSGKDGGTSGGTSGGLSCGPGTTAVDGQCVVATAQEAGAPAPPTLDAGGDAATCAKAMLYPDKDGDGFGSTIEAALSLCTGTPGYAGNNLDCADGDKRAHPGQADFFGTPIVGVTTGDPFDFNCDGKVDLQYPDIQGCSAGPHPVGWQAQVVPKCGVTGSLNLTACEETATTQGCR